MTARQALRELVRFQDIKEKIEAGDWEDEEYYKLVDEYRYGARAAWTNARLALESQDGQWQPIETAPKDGTYILLGRPKAVWIGKYLPVFQSGYVPANPWASMMINHDHIAERYGEPTHWRELPPAPKPDGREEGT